MSHDIIKQVTRESPRELCTSQTCPPTERVETKPFPSRGREGGPNPFPTHWLKIPGGGQDTQPQTVHMWPVDGAQPCAPGCRQHPSHSLDKLPGTHPWQACVPTRGMWSSGCSPGSSHYVTRKRSQLAPPLQFLRLTTSVHVPLPST